ncbi:MAG TPA: DinB family protein [Holophagaceae bacterium]|nr:DinB family protein [Holophagaceae bacterium]
MTAPHARPVAEDYPSAYAGYISKVPEEADVVEMLALQPLELKAIFGEMTDDQAMYRYEPGKWSLKQLLGHLADAEREFGHRAFRFSRADPTPLPGFDEDAYVANGTAEMQPLAELLDEFMHLRSANLSLIRNLRPAAWELRGVANGKEGTVRTYVFVLAGHMRHHLDVLRDRYVPELPTRGR